MTSPDSLFQPDAWRQLNSLPGTEGYAGGYAGITGGVLYYAGGTNFAGKSPWADGIKTWSGRIYRLDSLTSDWQPAGELPKPLAYGASLTVDGRWLLIGGGDAQRHYAEVWQAVARSDGTLDWSRLPNLPKANAYCSAVEHKGILYVAAGTDDPAMATADLCFWSLNLEKPDAVWQELDPWPGPKRILAVMAVAGDEVFLFSGKGVDVALKPEDIYLTDGYAYHTTRKNWRKLAPLPFPSAAIPSPAPVINDQTIVILGGNDGTIGNIMPVESRPDFPATLYFYDVRHDRWTRGENLPFGQKVTPTVQWQDHLIIPSGELRPGVRTPTVWAMEHSQDKR
jgi:N-acetylneuraminate epimerase